MKKRQIVFDSLVIDLNDYTTMDEVVRLMDSVFDSYAYTIYNVTYYGDGVTISGADEIRDYAKEVIGE